MYEAMFKRRSIRRYAGPIGADVMAEVEAFARSLRPLDPGIRTEVRFLDDEEVHGPFKVAAPHFLAIYSEAAGDHAANAGFMLQQMDLFLSSRGIGSCWQGGPKPPREAREVSGLKYVIGLAFGRPGEEVHRRSVAEFKRKPLAEITDIKGMDDVLEAARLAPSGMNRQGWYFTGGDGSVDVLSARTLLAGRMGQIDAGIALCHLWLSASHGGKGADVVIEPPSAGVRRGYEYVATVKMH
mgnify:FL=1